MKAWELQDFGIQNVQLVEKPIPEPGPNDLLVRVSAVSLNFRDKAIIEGLYQPELMPKPLTLVSDAAGEVVEVGKNVTRFQKGDRVTSHLYTHWIERDPGPNESLYGLGGPLPGGLAEYMLLHEDAAVATPESLTDEEAATLPIAALTSWIALVDYGKIRADQTILVQGTGGVSLFAVQIASAYGARIIATSSSYEKLERVKALGATDLINYTENPEWQKIALDLTAGKGVDHVLDVVGGDSLNRSIEATRVGGLVTVLGFITGQASTVNLMPLIFGRVQMQGIAVGYRKAFEQMNQMFERHRIKPVIDTVYPFTEAISALKRLDRGAFGKIVIRVTT